MKHTAIIGLSALMALATVGCKNSDIEFPDYDGGVSAYFAHQFPVKTITLGDDGEQDNTLDNKHQCIIYATQGGAYKSRDLKIEVAVDATLADGLTFPDGSAVKVMPADYYTLSSNTLTKMKDYLFGTTVTLTDKFFADPDAAKTTYVIPVKMLSAAGADRILAGTLADDYVGKTVSPVFAEAWTVAPKDYVLYGITYINPWTASYLRRGVDKVTEGGKTTEVKRHKIYVEEDEVVKLTTLSLNDCSFKVSTEVPDGEGKKTLTADLKLSFAADGKVTVTTATPGMKASGEGQFVKLGEKKSWGSRDRDGLYLNYTVDFGGKTYATTDTLVMRTRDVAPVFDFKPTYTK